MKCWFQTILQTLMAFLTLALGASAFEIEYLGSIDDDLRAPTSLQVHAAGVAVLEPYSKEIRLFSPEGVFRQKVHLAGNPLGLARLTPDRYLVCDRERGSVLAVDMLDQSQSVFVGPDAGLVAPTDVLISGEQVYVLDAGAGLIRQFDKTGRAVAQITLSDPEGKAVDYASSFDHNPLLHRFYVVDQLQSRVVAIGSDGQAITSFGSFGSGSGEFTRGGEIAVAPDGRVFVADRFQGRIVVYDADGKYLGHAGDGPESPRTLAIPTGIDVDENGIVYVASTMGSGISIYHAPYAAKPARVTEARHEFPEEGAEISTRQLRLVAFAEAEDVVDLVTGFDFRLFVESDLSRPVEEAEAVAPVPGTGSEIHRVTGEWIPQNELKEGALYHWSVRTRTSDTLSDWSALRAFKLVNLPENFHLRQNYPNPFNLETRISFALPRSCRVNVEIYSLLGRLVKVVTDRVYEAGNHEVFWDGTDRSGAVVASGVYFYRLSADEFAQSKKMVLLK